MRRVFTILLLVLAIAMIAVGVRRKHKVYDLQSAVPGMLMFHRVPERELIVDSTFTGVIRQDGRLCTVYNRSEPRTKRKCPT